MNDMIFIIIMLTAGLVVGIKTSAGQMCVNWQPCPELSENITILSGVGGITFGCAHLAVPLDYTGQVTELLELVLFRAKATKQPILGTVWINFGGPGTATALDDLALFAAELAANIRHQ